MPPKRSLARPRQTKLSFSPASNASPRPAKPRFVISSDSEDGPSPSRPAKRQRLERETERGMKLGMPVSQNKRGMFGSSDNEMLISSGSSSDAGKGYGEDDVAPSPRKTRKKAKKIVISDDEVEARPKHKNRRAARKSTKATSEEESEGEVTVVQRKDKRRLNKAPEFSEEEEEVRPKDKKRGTARGALTISESESEGKVTVVPRKDKRKRANYSEESEAEKKSRSKKASRRAKKPAPGSSGSSENNSEDEVVATPKKLTRKRKPVAESSEEETSRAKRKGRRAQRRASTPRESDAEEQEEDSNAEVDELKEELAFLQSSPLGLGSTQNKAKSAREKALEAMKKKRAVNSDPPSSSAGRRKPVVLDSESDSDLEIIPEEPDESSSEEHESDESDEEEYGPTAQEALYGNDEDEEFINDDDAPIGVPAEHALPLQFSSFANRKPRDLFKYAIDWMVQKKINPAFNSGDEIYDLAFKKLDDEVIGLAGSKYHSSAWTSDFTKAIKGRPEIVVEDIDPQTRALSEPHCEACNRRSHPATFALTFTGKPYQKETLEPLPANASDSDSDSDSGSSAVSSTGSEEALNGEKPTYNVQGERIPPESKTFSLGSTCKANAQVAHTLYHWRYHLNSWVIDYLVSQGHCTAEELVKRDKLSQRKRQKLANKIIDRMDKVGEIKKLYRMYKEQVNWAYEADNEYRKGWGRRG
ncbi:uncharacterized protein N0V89_004723 [Didymosphaeria variabile]|uniref:DUF4211 domain-containing protein n=1 Tax=Didymosphaeria variabile TaxID=1932322 RepID=A0A9W8XR32_9PLEO|nr:uncharacterized protein N0V89_004723 [Didymosphaeria variabile]KAJ4356687.1 hypothetical protein N0V89_004723 [Didymosphaeria variabile]